MNHLGLLNTLLKLVALFRSKNDCEQEALEYLRRATAICTTCRGENSLDVAILLNNAASLYNDLNDDNNCVQYLQKAYAIFQTYVVILSQ